MSRWFAIAGVILFALTMVAGCGGNDARGNRDQLSVLATTSIIGALAGEVAGDRAEVTSLMRPGVDPHHYEPSPGDIRTAADADVILMNGIGLDEFIVRNVESSNPDVPVVVVTEGIELHEGSHTHDEHGNDEHADDDHDHDHEEDEHAGEDADDHGRFDPHVWQDPIRAMTMVDNIAAALSEADPENAATYEANAAAYKTTLQETDAEIRAIIEEIPPENRRLVTNHDSLGYFADRYGLKVVATVIPNLSTDADPSASQIADLVDLLESSQLPAIFTERLVDPKIAEQIAADTGTMIITGLYTDSTGDEGTPAETLHGMLLENARLIREGLG